MSVPLSSRDKIYDAAEALFARRGYAGIGLREVAAEVGLGKSSLFHHFATELEEFVHQGLLHGHSEAREQFKKDIHYRRYLLGHHDEGH